MRHRILLAIVLLLRVWMKEVSGTITCKSLGLRVSEILMDAAVKDLIWLPNKVVFVITERRTLYRSEDDGRTFQSVMADLEEAEGQEAPLHNGVMSMHPSDADPRRVFFKGGGRMHWVTYNGGKSFHARRDIEMPLHDVKLHQTDPNCILATRLNDRCIGLSAKGFCYQSLYVSYDFGKSFKRAVDYVQQFDWGPHDDTVVYSAFDDAGETHQFYRKPSELNVYRSSDKLRTKYHSRLVVRKGVGFKVSKSGVYVAVSGDDGTMQLYVSRDDAQSFLPAVFPSELKESRYTIMDESDGTVFISVEHKDQDKSGSDSLVTVGDLYASVADGEVLFKDDFEGGLSKWRGKFAKAVPGHSRVVQDPLCEKESDDCRGKVLKMDGCTMEGDAFSLQSFTCSVSHPCKISFWTLGSPWQGFSEGFPSRHIWSAAADEAEDGLHHKTPVQKDRWTRVEYVFPRKHSEFVWDEGKRAVAGKPINRVRVMLEANNGYCNETYYDDIRVTRARAEDYVVALRDNTRDMLGHVDLHLVRGLNGILMSNVMSDEHQVKTLHSIDNGNEWTPLQPPEKHSGVRCHFKKGRGRHAGWRTEDDEACGLHLHLGHKTKGEPGKWEFRMHKEADKRFGALVTNRHAIGLMLGVGNVGTGLAANPDEANTYVSRDAGTSFTEVMKGSTAFDVADQGTLALLAKNSESTDEITVSVDGGLNFRACRLDGPKLEVKDVMADPNASSTNFLVYGTVPGESKAVFYSVDFSMIFPRQCSDVAFAGDPGSDFELWKPLGEENGCEMGREIEYVRRKPGARCYVGSENRLARLGRDCSCMEADYECDFCYERAGEAKAAEQNISVTSCVWSCDGPEKKGPSGECLGTYLQTRGYRKIEGNTCQGGLDLHPVRLECPRHRSPENSWFDSSAGESNSESSSWGSLFSGFFLIVGGSVVAGGFVYYLKNSSQAGEMVEAVMAHLSSFGARAPMGYSQVSTTERDDFALADELLNHELDNDDEV